MKTPMYHLITGAKMLRCPYCKHWIEVDANDVFPEHGKDRKIVSLERMEAIFTGERCQGSGTTEGTEATVNFVRLDDAAD